MTGRIASLTPTHVTLCGVTLEYGENTRLVLERSAADGCEVEIVTNNERTRVKEAARYFPAVKL